jgi:3-dehydroquinate synthase
VAIGIALDSFIAMKQGLLARGEFDRIIGGLLDCGLPVWCESLDARAADGELVILEGLEQFREHLGGVLNVTLPQGIGRKVEVHHISPDAVGEAVAFLRDAGGGGGSQGWPPSGTEGKPC